MLVYDDFSTVASKKSLFGERLEDDAVYLFRAVIASLLFIVEGTDPIGSFSAVLFKPLRTEL